MKQALITILIAWYSLHANAQKHNVFTDIGISFSRLYPGSSATYSYKPLRFLGVGVGFQAIPFYPTITNPHQYVPAIYGDIRFTIMPRKKNQFFALMNIGINLYRHSHSAFHQGNYDFTVINNCGNYTSFGVGYFYSLTKHMSGPYFSLKTIMNSYKVKAYNFVTQEQNIENWSSNTAIISLGYRF